MFVFFFSKWYAFSVNSHTPPSKPSDSNPPKKSQARDSDSKLSEGSAQFAQVTPDTPATKTTKSQTSPARKPQSMLSVFILLIFSGVVLFYLQRVNISSSVRSLSTIFFTLLFFCTAIPLFIWLVKYLFRSLKFLISKPELLLIVAVAVMVLSVSGIIVIRAQRYRLSSSKVTLMQELLARGMYLKTMGDDIQGGKMVPAGWDMTVISGDTSMLLADLLHVQEPRMFRNYYRAQEAWDLNLYDAVSGVQPWGDVSSMPTQYEITLTDKQAVQALSDSIDRIALLKEFGDNAIAAGDTSSMRYIAAKAQAEYYFLDGIGNAENPGLFSFTPGHVSAAASSGSFRRTVCVTNNGKTTCIANASQAAYKAYSSAHNYSVGEPSEQWTTGWEESGDVLEASDYSMNGAGLTTGEGTEQTYSPTVQRFFDDCRLKGGTTAVSSSVKMRLPTTESGYTCEYGNDGGCWDLLTYSGGRHMGGNPGCPEYNLVPAYPGGYFGNIVGPIGDAFVTVPDFIDDVDVDVDDASSWDGTYTITMTGGACNIPGLAYYAFSPYSEELVVQGNSVEGASGPVPIDEAGNASTTFSFNEGTYGGTYTDTWVFAHTDTGTTVSGSFQFTGSGVEYVYVSVNCWGTYSGSR